MKYLFLAFLWVFLGCVGASAAPVPYLTAPCEERQAEDGEKHYWARFEVEAPWYSDHRAFITVPSYAEESVGADPSLKFYQAELVLVGSGVVDVWCGEGDGQRAVLVEGSP